MNVELIAAMSENHVIGCQGRLPWHLPNDLKRFKSITIGEHILMGRKTFASIGKALPKRHNLVLTHDVNFSAPDVEVIHHKEEVLRRDYARLLVIGGEEIYRLFFADCQKIHLTLVHTTVPGDAFFPELHGFTLRAREDHASDAQHRYPYSFLEYERF
jgi:dihydrofolate reductase